jgi:hypothetical protein
MLRNRGLALKLIVLILSSITLIFSAVLTYNYFFSRQIITNNIERNANHLHSNLTPLTRASFTLHHTFTNALTA